MCYITLDDFVTGYTDCLLWCGIIEDDNYTSDDEYSSSDLTPDAESKIWCDCEDFVVNNCNELTRMLRAYPDFDSAKLGHLFYLNRNRYGSGFWEYDGFDILNYKSKEYGEQIAYVDDNGKVEIF